MKASGLPDSTLDKIWELSDQDKDGFLDRYEWTVAIHLTVRANDFGDEIPDQVVICYISSHFSLNNNTVHCSFPLNCSERTFQSLSQILLGCFSQ